jgi:hypothetical protein
MTELYLVAHKVRGEPAFDIATRLECPECEGTGPEHGSCVECESLGYWWIVPTSGHRAYPWWWTDLAYVGLRDGEPGNTLGHDIETLCGAMSPDLPDHYAHKAAPAVDLATALGLRDARPISSQPFPRRL